MGRGIPFEGDVAECYVERGYTTTRRSKVGGRRRVQRTVRRTSWLKGVLIWEV